MLETSASSSLHAGNLTLLNLFNIIFLLHFPTDTATKFLQKLNLSLVSIISVSSHSEGYANQVTLCEKMPHHQLILCRSSSLLEIMNPLHTQTRNFKALLKNYSNHRFISLPTLHQANLQRIGVTQNPALKMSLLSIFSVLPCYKQIESKTHSLVFLNKI